MKIHLIEKKEVIRRGGLVPAGGLCVYEAEPNDLWTGWFAQGAGWSGNGVVLAARVGSREKAVDVWITANPLASRATAKETTAPKAS